MGRWVYVWKRPQCFLETPHSPLLLSPQTSCFFPLSAVCAFTVLLWLMSLGRGCSLQLSRSSTLNVPQGIILHTANWTLNSYCLHEKPLIQHILLQVQALEEKQSTLDSWWHHQPSSFHLQLSPACPVFVTAIPSTWNVFHSWTPSNSHPSFTTQLQLAHERLWRWLLLLTLVNRQNLWENLASQFSF